MTEISIVSPLDRVMSDVPRWTIVRTIRRQNVAEHSYFVALWMPRLLRRHGIIDAETILAAVEYALHHDMSEVTTGDVPAPLKIHLPPGALDHAARALGVAHDDPGPLTSAATKVLDLFEAALFISEDIALGNHRVTEILRVIKTKMQTACAAFEELTPDSGASSLYMHLSMLLYTARHGLADPFEGNDQ